MRETLETEQEQLKFPVPDALKPNKETGEMFPRLNADNIRELAENGWRRIGILPIIVNPAGEILILTHKANEKVEVDTRAVMGETLIFNSRNGKIETEQVPEAVSRAFSEELGLFGETITKLDLKTREHGAWELVSFPLGGSQYALGLVLVLHVDEDTAKIVTGGPVGFVPNEEIAGVSFARPEAIIHSAKDPATRFNFRPGTDKVIGAALEPLTLKTPLVSLHLPAPKERTPESEVSMRSLLET